MTPLSQVWRQVGMHGQADKVTWFGAWKVLQGAHLYGLHELWCGASPSFFSFLLLSYFYSLCFSSFLFLQTMPCDRCHTLGDYPSFVPERGGALPLTPGRDSLS